MNNKEILLLILVLFISSLIFFFQFNFYVNKFAFTRYLVYLSLIPVLLIIILFRFIKLKKIFSLFFLFIYAFGFYDIYKNYPKLNSFLYRNYDNQYLSTFDEKKNILVFDKNDHFAEILTSFSISNSNFVPYPIFVTGYFREQNNVEEIDESFGISNLINQNILIKNKARLSKKDFKLLVKSDDLDFANLLEKYVINFSKKINSNDIFSNYDFRDGMIFTKLNKNLELIKKFKFLNKDWFHYKIRVL